MAPPKRRKVKSDATDAHERAKDYDRTRKCEADRTRCDGALWTRYSCGGTPVCEAHGRAAARRSHPAPQLC